MERITKKEILSRKEILALSEKFSLGKTLKISRIKKGNINTNYLLVTERGKFIIRKYNFKNEKQVGEEVKLINYLRKNRLPVPKIIGRIKNIVAYHYIEKTFAKSLNYGIPAMRMLAKIHNLTKHYKYDYPGESQKVILNLLNEKIDGYENELNLKLSKELRKIKFSSLPKSIVHVDLKPENVIVKDKRISGIIDFDNAYRDFSVIDIGSTIMWWCINKSGINWRRADMMLNEYQKERKLSNKEKTMIKQSVMFNLLKQAFKYAYICRPSFGKKYVDIFLSVYEDLNRINF